MQVNNNRKSNEQPKTANKYRFGIISRLFILLFPFLLIEQRLLEIHLQVLLTLPQVHVEL